MFDEFIKSGDVKIVAKNPALAKTLLRLIELRKKDLQSREPNSENAFKIIEDAYDIFLSFIEALLAAKGYTSYSHEANIDFLAKFYPGKFSPPELNRLNKYRIQRNNIKYRGFLAAPEEAQACLEDVKLFSTKLLEILKVEGIT
jgi:uncharacterized protein (UPF0332 family)